MASVAKIEAQMRESSANVAYSDLHKVCVHYFGEPRQNGTSHAIFRTPCVKGQECVPVDGQIVSLCADS